LLPGKNKRGIDANLGFAREGELHVFLTALAE
jgi:hypothetical protein